MKRGLNNKNDHFEVRRCVVGGGRWVKRRMGRKGTDGGGGSARAR